jgi:hypothetical protein
MNKTNKAYCCGFFALSAAMSTTTAAAPNKQV